MSTFHLSAKDVSSLSWRLKGSFANNGCLSLRLRLYLQADEFKSSSHRGLDSKSWSCVLTTFASCLELHGQCLRNSLS